MPKENENEIKQTVEPEVKPEPAPADVDEFIKLAKEAKENSVSREDFDKLKADNAKLMRTILEGEEIEKQEKASKPDIAELKGVFKNPDATNLEIVTASLGIRDAVIAETGKDPFAAKDEERSAAERVARIFQECVDEAAGDSEKFNYLLNSRMAEDDAALITAINKRRKQRK